MSYSIAAAGTGGHVFPALAVAEALVADGVARSDIVFFGGDRLEAKVLPAEGFPFVPLQLRGLRRNLSPRNLAIPRMLQVAARLARREMEQRHVRAVLGMGSYVTVPVAWSAYRAKIPLFLHEQNAEAGLANRLMCRLARTTFVSFDPTLGLTRTVLTGNPVRRALAGFSRSDLRHVALQRYGLNPGPVTIGVFGGSQGAAAINRAVADVARDGIDAPVQILHLAGREHEADMRMRSHHSAVPWTILGFEAEMQYFYAACDLVVARSGGAVAELAVTGTPAVLVPGAFGGGHQRVNAERFAVAGAAVVLDESRLGELGRVLGELVADPLRRMRMARACAALARPDAATTIARSLEEVHG